jgi:hypothetical protein
VLVGQLVQAVGAVHEQTRELGVEKAGQHEGESHQDADTGSI